jgi:Zn-dependent protease with chaperone function
MLDMIGRDEDKLATVLGHEAAHVVARHSAEGVGLRALLGGAGWLVCTFFKTFSSTATRSYRCARSASCVVSDFCRPFVS